MIAKYQNKLYNAEYVGDKILLWSYKFNKEFNRKILSNGKHYYSLLVDTIKIEKLYSIEFTCKWKEYNFNMEYLPTVKCVKIMCDNYNIVNSFNFKKYENGIWSRVVKIRECNNFTIKYINEFTNEIITYKNISKRDIAYIWKNNITILNHDIVDINNNKKNSIKINFMNLFYLYKK